MLRLFNQPHNLNHHDLAEIESRLLRIETRLCKLIVALGYEDILRDPTQQDLKDRKKGGKMTNMK